MHNHTFFYRFEVVGHSCGLRYMLCNSYIPSSIQAWDFCWMSPPFSPHISCWSQLRTAKLKHNAITSLLTIVGAASERAPKGSCCSDHRLLPCLHGGRDHQLSPCHWPLLHPQLHQQVRPQDIQPVTQLQVTTTQFHCFSKCLERDATACWCLYIQMQMNIYLDQTVFHYFLYIFHLIQTLFCRCFISGDESCKESFYLLKSIMDY